MRASWLLSWLRWSATWLALFALLGVGQILPAVHFVFVAHRICAEHGETLHLEQGEPRARGRGATATEAEISQGAAAEHEHEHCGVLGAASSARATLAGAACAMALPAPWALQAPDVECSPHIDIPLLFYAPKLAPPV